MIYIERNSKIPLYEQIYNHFVKEILSGNLLYGSKLPPTRKLAEDLSIGRNTVDKAYQQLVAEGYIQAKSGSGFTVNSVPNDNIYYAKRTPSITKSESPITVNLYDFAYGTMSNADFPYNTWRKSMNNVLLEMETMRIIPYPEKTGELKLRKEIAEYIYHSRGVICSPDQIIITSGQQHSCEIIANMFKTSPKKFAMEDPGYDGIRKVFINHGYEMNYIPVEDDGISIDSISSLDATLLYLTPSHQFPTGAVLSIGKRKEILNWAYTNNTYIIEDDYDSELRYYTNPIPSMQSLDVNNRTIYTGTFSKALAPMMRTAYIVFPDELLPKYYDYYQRYNSQVSSLHQLILADFISSGNYEKHINKLRTKYKKKLQILRNTINIVFGNKATITGGDAGIHLLLNVNTDLSQDELIDRALSIGIKVYPTKVLYMNDNIRPYNQLLLGYPTVPEDQFENIFTKLKMIWEI